MSLHPSLKIDKAGSAQRTVMTRIERIKEMMKKGLWSDASSVTALPKTKIVRIKAKKKTAAEAAPGAEGAAAPAAAAGGKPAAAAKPAAPAKK
jgi:small basic protein (TIGR04137 family)